MGFTHKSCYQLTEEMNSVLSLWNLWNYSWQSCRWAVLNFFLGQYRKVWNLKKIRYLTERLKVSNQKIKTIRMKSYGLPDDEYFFLKLFDDSRQRWKSLEDDWTKIPQFLGLNLFSKLYIQDILMQKIRLKDDYILSPAGISVKQKMTTD